MKDVYDCIVVGSGHAGSCAALAAVQNGCKSVVVLEKSPKEWAGGNGYFTAGAHRTAHGGLSDLLPIVNNVTPEQAETIDLAAYTAQDFRNDIMRLGEDKPNQALVEALVSNSRETIDWLAKDVGVHFNLAFNRQAYNVDGRQKFWGGLALGVVDGGKGLIADDHAALDKLGIQIEYDTPATRILMDESNSSVIGVMVRRKGAEVQLRSKAVILACGGFEASKQLRCKYLGKSWENARVRGTPYNTGDGLKLASQVGAKLTGDWSNGGCHSTCWDAGAHPDAGDRMLSNQFTKSGYPLGLMLNVNGHRFVDEGIDFRNYTYAKFGKAILEQPGGVVFQIFDSQVSGWLRNEEYADDVVKKVYSETLDGLANQLVHSGLIDVKTFLVTITAYNHAVEAQQKHHLDIRWNPSVKDGVSTGPELHPAKSNWALPIVKPPFLAVKVACGITFTFGGLSIDPKTAGVVSDETGRPIPGLFCTGELVGDLFYGNYPGGSGLMSGAVFGRKAGKAASALLSSN